MNIDWKNSSMTAAQQLDASHLSSGGRQLKLKPEDNNRGFNVVVVRKQQPPKDPSMSIQNTGEEAKAPELKLSGRLHPGRKNYEANPNYA